MSFKRLGAALLVAITSFPQVAEAQTPTADHLRRTYGHILPASACDTDEFIVRFNAGISELSDFARTQLQADLRHPRSCNVEVVYLGAYDPAALAAVRSFLIAEGLPPEFINAIQFSVPIAPFPYEFEDVRVTLIYH